jgi:hypothetical protein
VSFPRNIYTARVAPTSIRNASAVVDGSYVWTEVFDENVWTADTRPVPIMLRHDADETIVGSVVARVAHNGWHVVDFMLDPERSLASVAYDRLRVGTGVSIGATSLRRDDNALSLVRRHKLARLEHIAILEPNQLPGIAAARVTRIIEPSKKLIVRQPASTTPARRPVEADLDDPAKYRLVSTGRGGAMYEEVSPR